MYANIAYLNNSIADFSDDSMPLIVGSCGHYRFHGEDVFHTRRPEGRQDYQLLYIASGRAYFTVCGEEKLLQAGNMVIYRPGESQDYVYYGEDLPEIYWVHFTGSRVQEILESYGIYKPMFASGTAVVYGQLFYQMITELPTRKSWRCASGRFSYRYAVVEKRILLSENLPYRKK